MRIMITVLALVTLSALAVGHAETSDYVDQTDRAIKALSPEEMNGYLNGRGMGLARAAELNGYPGPKHVLELATELQLTADQERQTRRLFDRMAASARAIGAQIVELETQLDHAFAGSSIDAERLSSLTLDIGRLQGSLRAVHLSAHLEQTALLSEHQLARYPVLRGYGRSGDHSGHRSHH